MHGIWQSNSLQKKTNHLREAFNRKKPPQETHVFENLFSNRRLSQRNKQKMRSIVENIMLLNWLCQLCCHTHWYFSSQLLHTNTHSTVLFNLFTFSHCDQRNLEKEKKIIYIPIAAACKQYVYGLELWLQAPQERSRLNLQVYKFFEIQSKLFGNDFHIFFSLLKLKTLPCATKSI